MTGPTDDPKDLSPALRESVGEARKLFMAAAAELRPRLHRFCARMCGSSLDGEDVVQESLADAFYNLAGLKETARLEPWLFRIAYHKCIDFLRRERRREDDVPFEDAHDRGMSPDEDFDDTPIDEALATLVTELPPKERASVVLKDVLGYSLVEIATIVESTPGGVKAALHRGRAKLRAVERTPALAELDAEQRQLLEAYADCFNRRDWDALRQLVRADARLEIVGAAEGRMAGLGASYSSNYTTLLWEWKLTAGVVDGLPAIIHWRRVGDEWRPHAAIRLWWRDGQVVRIRDYIHVDYLLRDAELPSS
jgi:RNA polymerase sigma-70 factor (ECF subfamily)